MQYNGLYFALFRGTMKKVLTERYGKNFANKTMRKTIPLYQRIVREADDLGKGNPMAYNELFALAFVAPYLACGKRITPEDVQEMMRRSLYHVKWYFSMVDLNTDKGKEPLAGRTVTIILSVTAKLLRKRMIGWELYEIYKNGKCPLAGLWRAVLSIPVQPGYPGGSPPGQKDLPEDGCPDAGYWRHKGKPTANVPVCRDGMAVCL